MQDSAQIFFMRTHARNKQCLADSNNYKYTDEIAFFYSKNCESDRYNNLAET